MIKKTIGEKATKIILLAITSLGAVLVGEQVLSGEQLTSIQGITGMLLGGGSISVLTIIYLIRDLLPAKTAQTIIDKVGSAKVTKGFDTIDTVSSQVGEAISFLMDLKQEILLDREVKKELGVYENLPQTLKDKLDV